MSYLCHYVCLNPNLYELESQISEIHLQNVHFNSVLLVYRVKDSVLNQTNVTINADSMLKRRIVGYISVFIYNVTFIIMHLLT